VRYFPVVKEVIKNDNAPVFDETADKKFTAAYFRGLRAYYKHLDSIKARLGRGAYNFFRFGSEDTGLHDGFLLSLNMGDGLGVTQQRFPKLRFGNEKSVVQMQVLNYKRDTLHSFEFKKLRKVVVDIPSEDPLWFTAGKTLGQIYTYEIVAASPKYLRNEWLLDSGGTITIEFEKLIYRRKPLMVKNRR